MVLNRSEICASNSTAVRCRNSSTHMFKTKIVFDGKVFVTYLSIDISVADFQRDLKNICGLSDQVNTY